jgi:hypothetical protein
METFGARPAGKHRTSVRRKNADRVIAKTGGVWIVDQTQPPVLVRQVCLSDQIRCGHGRLLAAPGALWLG